MIAEQWVQVADKLDDNIFLRMIFSVRNNTNVEKTVIACFSTLYLGNSRNLDNLLDKDFSELG
ncbi:hypothetical protein R6Q59_015681 [Mikania micrantha]